MKMKVFNYSELHFSEGTSFKIHTLKSLKWLFFTLDLLFSNFYLDFYFPFSIWTFNSLFVWTFISLFCLDFYFYFFFALSFPIRVSIRVTILFYFFFKPIAVTFWISFDSNRKEDKKDFFPSWQKNLKKVSCFLWLEYAHYFFKIVRLWNCKIAKIENFCEIVGT